MAVADAAPTRSGSPRPSWGHMLRRGVLAALAVAAASLAVYLVAWLLPGHLDEVFDRATGVDRAAFTGGSTADVLGNVAIAVLGAVVFAFALWSQVRSRNGEVASGFWILAAALLGAVIAYHGKGQTTSGAFFVTLVAARYLAFDADGRPVPSPLRLRLPSVGVAIVLLELAGVVVVAAIVHPLEPDVNRSPAVNLYRQAGEPVLATGLVNNGPATIKVTAASGPGIARLRRAVTITPGEQDDLTLSPSCTHLHPGQPLPVTLTFASGHRQRVTVPAVSHGCR